MTTEKQNDDLKTVEYMMRVKLPDPNGYAACPSGDTDYEVDYRKALDKAKPDAFEIVWERPGVLWPKDSSGYTYVRLKLKDPNNAMEYWRSSALSYKKKLDSIKEFLSKTL